MEWSQWVIYSLNIIVIPIAITSTIAFNKKIKEYGLPIKNIEKLIIVVNLIFFAIQIPIQITDFIILENYFVLRIILSNLNNLEGTLILVTFIIYLFLLKKEFYFMG